MTSNAAVERPVWNPARLWRALVEPVDAIERPAERRRARLLSALLLPTTLSVFIGAIAQDFAISMIVALIGLTIAYAISRTKHYAIAGFLTILLLSVPTLYSAFTTTELSTDGMTTIFMWLALSLLLSSFLLPLNYTLLVSVGAILLAALIPLLRPAIPYNTILTALGFVGTISALVMLSASISHRDRRQIQEQTEALERQTEDLRATNKDLVAARRQAEEANRLKSQFLSTMSHELRTPLNAIIGFTEIMLAGMGGIDLPEKAQSMTERVHANSKELLMLINDVLDLAKIEAQRVELVNKPFSPAELMEAIHGEMMSLADQQELDFVLDTALDAPQEVTGDQSQVRRVVTNLLSNAFKFTERGQVMLSTSGSQNGAWTISVTDTGIGIPPHALEFIFDPFRQIDGSTQRAYGGTGLGLAITQELVKSMGGAIQVESALGRGSTFVVTLPLAPPGDEQNVKGGTT